MKHERAPAKTICADFEPGAIRREWVLADRPLKRIVGSRLFKVLLSIVEDDFEEALCSRVGQLLVACEDWIAGGAVTIFNAFEISIAGPRDLGAVTLVGLGQRNPV